MLNLLIIADVRGEEHFNAKGGAVAGCRGSGSKAERRGLQRGGGDADPAGGTEDSRDGEGARRKESEEIVVIR